MKNKTIFILVGIILANRFCAHSQAMSMQMQGSLKNSYLLMMDTMMNKMMSVPEPVSAESDFNRQMIVHHEGAIAMARYEISYGKDFSMIQLAKSILAEQLVEIQQMHLWLNQFMNKQVIPTGYSRDMPQTMSEMMHTMPADNELNDIDRAFALVMIPHHQAAINMARVIINYSNDQQTIKYAKQLISNEEIEIEQMSVFLKNRSS